MKTERYFLLTVGLFCFDLAIFQDGDDKPKEPDFAEGAKCIIHQEDYDGKFVKDKQFKALSKVVESEKEDVLKSIYEITGLYLVIEKKVHVKYDDDKKKGPWAITSTHRDGAIITFHLAIFFENKQDPKQVYQHEMVHAIQRCAMAKGEYDKVPHWFREGIAVFTAGQGPGRVKRIFDDLMKKEKDVEKAIKKMINGLEGKHTRGDYGEDYLAFQYLNDKFGKESIKKLACSVTFDAKPYKEVIEEITKLSYKEFCDAAKEFAIEYVRLVAKKKEDKKDDKKEDKNQKKNLLTNSCLLEFNRSKVRIKYHSIHC